MAGRCHTEPELPEDARHVLLHRRLADDQSLGYAEVRLPLGHRGEDASSRGLRLSSAFPGAGRPIIRRTTSESRAVPPEATRVMASVNVATSPTRSLSR